MRNKHKLLLVTALTALAGAAAVYIFSHYTVAVLQPKGTIAHQQRDLMVIAALLMLIVVVPVYIMTFAIVLKYRAGSKKARYTPEWDGHKLIEAIWWIVPSVIILVLAVFTWKSSHALDPFKPLYAEKKPLKINVVALQWKWLFVYPEQNIATINSLYIPEDTPIDFTITSDAPMNSFWVPQLGGQVYAMSGMSTQLHLMADEPGVYRGSSANLSGEGFARMNFNVEAKTQDEFKHWVAQIQQGSNELTYEAYNALAIPSTQVGTVTYAHVQDNLYDAVLMKYTNMPEMNREGGAH